MVNLPGLGVACCQSHLVCLPLQQLVQLQATTLYTQCSKSLLWYISAGGMCCHIFPDLLEAAASRIDKDVR